MRGPILSRRPWSVRLRLTLWYVAALALIILAFSLGIYLFVRASLLQEMDQQLHANVSTVAQVVPEGAYELGELEEHGTVALFQVRDGGRVIYQTAGWQKAALDQALQGRRVGSAWDWPAREGHLYRMRAATLRSADRTIQVAVAQDEGVLRHSLRRLALTLLIGFPCALVLAVVGGYFLAGRALSPISAMASKAREITAEQLSERLPVENPDDEFGRLAMAFNDTLVRLEDSFERLRRFTADASHELRTPLTAIRSVGEVSLQEERDSPFYRDVIGSMLEETDRLTRLVDSLLTLTRAESRQVPLHRELIALDRLAGDAADCLRVLAEEKGQTLRVDVTEAVDVEADYATLRQALINLLDNAIKYAPERGHIRIVVGHTPTGDAAIAVIDDGPGIAPEHQDKIFNRFYRIEPERSRQLSGTGLGLAIARWAVRVNGGHLALDCDKGNGCTFRITLPVPQGGGVYPPDGTQSSPVF